MVAKTILDKPARAVVLIIFIFNVLLIEIAAADLFGVTAAPVKSAVAGW